MDITSLTAPAVNATTANWTQTGMVDRFWRGDPSVWSDDPDTPELGNRLGWLDLHDTMRPELADIERVAGEVAARSDHVVLCGMGGSSLAPDVFSAVFGRSEGFPELIVLDSTHPGAVLAVESRIDPARTTFVISSKSGTTLETLSFFRYFWAATGGDGERFIAVTDPGSRLSALGRDRGFHAVFEANPDVGGRFSALTHFGLVPAALMGVDVAALLDAAARLAAQADSNANHDPVAGIGIALAEAARVGRDKLTILTSPSLSSLPAWMEQLIAESLGKDGTGIVPVADEPIGDPSVYGPDRVFLSYQLQGEHAPDLERLSKAGFPVIGFELPTESSLGYEMLRAEGFTAVAGAVLGVHPFNQPNVEAAKDFARRAMSGDLDLGSVETLTGSEAAAALVLMVDGLGPGGYFGVHAYLPPGDGLWSAITDLRTAVRAKTGVATTAGWGPRFLHSTGQLHKGGPAGGAFVQLVDDPGTGLAVPETENTFDEIIGAQSAGDRAALIEAGRDVIRIDVGSDAAGMVRSLIGALA
ncbi:MAG: glucose-6-phosphate isomerase [Acidimicrobiia bacterium]|nr:glucose-6-phosphate isomerase [Acidimicrobiia bacterium]